MTVQSTEFDFGRRTIPEGYVAVAVDPAQHDAPLRACVLCRTEPDAAGDHLVVVRDLLTGRALLGGVVDAGGIVHQWIEVWIQDAGNLAGAPTLVRETLSNAIIDDHWRRAFEASQDLDDGLLLRTGWETSHPKPTFIDRRQFRAVHPRDKEGNLLRLCEDDGRLAAAGLPAFGSTRHQYLEVVPEDAEGPPPEASFVPVTPDAPVGDATAPLDDVVEGLRDCVPLNPTGGLIQMRRYAAIGLEPFVEILGGAPWDGIFHGETKLEIAETLRALSQAELHQRLVEGHLVLGGEGRGGRLIEVFHLKLRLLTGAVACVQRFIRATQRPLLDLDASSFQIRLGEPGLGLPYLWTASAVLVDPGRAIPLPVEGSDLTYYFRGGGEEASIYRPASGRERVSGLGDVRIRQLIPEAEGAMIVEGTLETRERLEPAANDLVWMRLQAAGRPVNLYARMDEEKAMARGEFRFRSVPQRFGDRVTPALERLTGVPVADVPFEHVPLLTSPCDLYSLAVLAVSTCLVGPDQTLAIALDEMLSLARAVAEYHDEEVSLALRVQGIIEGDERWLRSLGPQHLVRNGGDAAQAFSFVPADLWFRWLGLVVRMFPGIGPDSICRDLGDAAPGGLHKVFEPVLDELGELLVRSRSLIVVDWESNREIHAVVRRRVMEG